MQGEKKLTFLTIGIFVGINLLNGGLFYYVNFMKLGKLKEDLAKLQEDVKKEDQTKSERIALREKIEQMKIKAEIASRVLPEPTFDMQDIFLKEVESFCQKARVGYSSIALVMQKEEKTAANPKTQQKKLYTPISVKLEVTGKFYDLVNFMYIIENETRLMKIDSFTFTPQQISGGKEKEKENAPAPTDVYLTLSLQITTFVRIPKEAAK